MNFHWGKKMTDSGSGHPPGGSDSELEEAAGRAESAAAGRRAAAGSVAAGFFSLVGIFLATGFFLIFFLVFISLGLGLKWQTIT